MSEWSRLGAIFTLATSVTSPQNTPTLTLREPSTRAPTRTPLAHEDTFSSQLSGTLPAARRQQPCLPGAPVCPCLPPSAPADSPWDTAGTQH